MIGDKGACSASKMNDGLVEVIGLYSSMHIAQMQVPHALPHLADMFFGRWA